MAAQRGNPANFAQPIDLMVGGGPGEFFTSGYFYWETGEFGPEYVTIASTSSAAVAEATLPMPGLTGSFQESTVYPLDTGMVLSWVALVEFRSFADLNAGERLSWMLADSQRNAGVRVDSSGNLYGYTLKPPGGAAETETDTGINVVSGTRYKIKCELKVGTHLKVWVDDDLVLTITTNLPNALFRAEIRKGGSSTANANVRFYGGGWKATLPG